MTDSFVTQCPHCQTSFRVSHAQLSVARGAVRCGACLQVFNAARQLLEQRGADDGQTPVVTTEAAVAPSIVHQAAIQPPSTPNTQVAPRAEEDDPWQVSELDLDSLNLDEELARLEKRDALHADTLDHTAAHPDESALTAHRDTRQVEEAAWIDTLHNDEVDHLPELHAQVIPQPDPGLDPNVDPARLDEHLDDERTEPSLGSSHGVDDDEPALPAFSARRAGPAGQHDAQPHKTKDRKEQHWSALDDPQDGPHDDSQDDEPELEKASRGKRPRNEPAVRDQNLLDLNDDPLRLDWKPPKPRRSRRLLWGLLALLALLGLAGQYVWYHFDQLARQDQYRPWFQQLCPQLGCKVPSKVDISLLKSSNLVVRSHPEFQGALVVDAIIYNRASFSQPFPLLELRFADTGGQLIASRRFKPSEYLSGEMAGKEEMPPQTPIHIALDILDPGAKAVNYSLYFRSPE